jgi:hypothetical protein
MRIREAQKHKYSTDPDSDADPQHWQKVLPVIEMVTARARSRGPPWGRGEEEEWVIGTVMVRIT